MRRKKKEASQHLPGEIYNIVNDPKHFSSPHRIYIHNTYIYLIPYAQSLFPELRIAGVTPDKSITNIEFSIDCLVYIIIYGKVGWADKRYCKQCHIFGYEPRI